MDIVIVCLYSLSLIYFGFRCYMMGVCYGDARSAHYARMKLIFSFFIFALMTIIASLTVSVWFALPLALLVLLIVAVKVVDTVKYGY